MQENKNVDDTNIDLVIKGEHHAHIEMRHSLIFAQIIRIRS